MSTKTLITILVIIILLVLFVGASCDSAGGRRVVTVEDIVFRPVPHPVFGTKVMLIPKGMKLGPTPAPEEGIYIANSVLALYQEEYQQHQEEQRLQKLTMNY